ncbi:MAG: LAGLIDADG family homing endonuclease [Nanoarchaeota archaeon]
MLKIPQVSSDPTVNIILDTIKIKKQALVFVNTKRSAEKTAEEISLKLKKNELLILSEQVLNSLSKPTKQCQRLAKCIQKGVAFHHAGLVQKQRELIEDNFKAGLIKVICATPTLCLSKDTKIWHGITETEVSKFMISNPLFALSKNKLISMKSQKVNRITNSSNLIKISSVSGHSIKVTPNHKMLVKRKKKKIIIQARNIKEDDKIATVGKLYISETLSPKIKDFIIDNNINIPNYKFGSKLSYFIGLMLGDGYSGAEIINAKVKYKGSPSIVGIDNEIFLKIQEFSNQLKLSCRKTKTYHGTPQLVLGKNKWFREFLVRCGVEKRDKKHLSGKLMRMNLENTAFLLRGLFDTDGYLDKKAGPGFGNISRKLVKQVQKCLLRYGIVTAIRKRKAGYMKIYEKEYKTAPFFELNIHQKKSIIDFYKFVGFGIKRKQDTLFNLIVRICSNLNYVSCDNCKYKIHKDIFSGRTKDQKKWGKIKLKVIKLIGKNGELGSRELKRILNYEPKKKDRRLNHHYELITKRKIGDKSKTEWFWSLNTIGKWIFESLIDRNKKIEEFFRLKNCPVCENKLDRIIKKGWRDADFEGDIFWDKIREIKETNCEKDVYDIVLSNKPKNDHMFVANGFIVHNSIGVDLPAFRTVLKDLRRYGHRGLTFIPVLEYLQMAGRAGRPKYDKHGEAICIANSPEHKEKLTEMYINGEPEEIYSKLAVEPALRMYVLTLISSGFVKNKQELLDFFNQTFFAFQYGDSEKLGLLIEKMVGLLLDWDFITSSKNDDFTAADEIDDEKYIPTLIGKRVAELYIDPLTASNFIGALKKETKKNEFSFLQMISSTLEIRPLLSVRTKEYEQIEEAISKYHDVILQNEPAPWDPDYRDFINSIKTSLFFLDWINEISEEHLLEQYSIRPGEIRVKIQNADWLLYAAEELSKLLKLHKLIKEIIKLRIRLKNGVKEELIPLLRLKQVGRVRARALYKNGIKDAASVKSADFSKLAFLLGRNVAVKVKEQVGEDYSSVKTGKRRGQISLKDF